MKRKMCEIDSNLNATTTTTKSKQNDKIEIKQNGIEEFVFLLFKCQMKLSHAMLHTFKNSLSQN